MKDISDKDLDKLFQDAAQGYSTPFDEAGWSDLSSRLEGGGGAFTYFKMLGIIISLFFIGTLAIWYYTPQSQSELNQPLATQSAVSNLGDYLAKDYACDDALEAASDDHCISNEGLSRSEEVSAAKESLIHTSKEAQEAGISEKPSLPFNPERSVEDTSTSGLSKLEWDKTYVERIAFGAPLEATKMQPDLTYPLGAFELRPWMQESNKEEIVKPKRSLAIKASYSPDLSSVGYFTPDRPGSNFGLMVEYPLSNKFFLSIGAVYSRKIYFADNESGGGYYSSSYTRLDGDCRVIDLPLNMGYYLKKLENHALYVVLGTSSYLMLQEDYTYTYSYQKRDQTLKNENNHLFGILNVAVGYEHQIRNNFFVQVEPFLKAPIAGIGEGQVDLVSTGAFINLKYMIKRKTYGDPFP